MIIRYMCAGICLIMFVSASSCRDGNPEKHLIIKPADNTECRGGESITFEASVPEAFGPVSSARWRFGDGVCADGMAAAHAYDSKGRYTVSFTATNEFREQMSDNRTLDITTSRFVKLDEQGLPVADNASIWAAVYDDSTGLVWEVKNDFDGIADYSDPGDADNTYTWYDSDRQTNGGDAGTPGDGTDTQDMISALNQKSWAGFTSWRMPTCEELAGLRDAGRFNPAVNARYFPQTAPWYYWSSTSYDPPFHYAACHIDFLGSSDRQCPALITSFNHYGMKDLRYHARGVVPCPALSSGATSSNTAACLHAQ